MKLQNLTHHNGFSPSSDHKNTLPTTTDKAWHYNWISHHEFSPCSDHGNTLQQPLTKHDTRTEWTIITSHHAAIIKTHSNNKEWNYKTELAIISFHHAMAMTHTPQTTDKVWPYHWISHHDSSPCSKYENTLQQPLKKYDVTIESATMAIHIVAL